MSPTLDVLPARFGHSQVAYVDVSFEYSVGQLTRLVFVAQVTRDQVLHCVARCQQGRGVGGRVKSADYGSRLALERVISQLMQGPLTCSS